MISGIVVILSKQAPLAEAVLHAIGQQPALEMGPLERQRLPLVLETETPAESQALTDWLHGLPGVEHIDVAYVHWEEVTEDPPTSESQRTCTESELRN